MCSVPIEAPAAQRARWLAELSDVLDAARLLFLDPEFLTGRHPETRELFLRIEAARLEVRSLRLSRSFMSEEEKAPKWIESLPWQRGVRTPG